MDDPQVTQSSSTGFTSRTVDAAQQFDASAKATAQEEEGRVKAQKAQHAEEARVTAERAAADVQKQDAAEERRKADYETWRKQEKAHQEEIAADKVRREAEAARAEEERRKKHATEEQKKAYLDSLHQHAHERTLHDRAEAEADEQLRQSILSAEITAREAKQLVEAEERRKKNDIERRLLLATDGLKHEGTEKQATLFSEQIRKKTMMESELRQETLRLGGIADAQLRTQRERELELTQKRKVAELEREMAKEKSALEADLRMRKRELEVQSQRERVAVENDARMKKATIDRELIQTRRQLEQERGKRNQAG